MNAIVIDQFVKDPSSLAVRTLPAKQSPPPPHHLRIRVTHASVTHVDLLYAQGLHQNNRRHAAPPFVLGTEFAGVVLAAGADASSAAPGARVFGFARGTYAEELCVHERQVRRVPAGWSAAEACAVGPSAAVSYGALVDAGRLRPGERVLVLGASGGLGVCAIQIARALGAKQVIGLVGEEEGPKADVVRRLGARTVSYRTPGWEKEVLEITGGEGVDLVYDSVGAVDRCLRCTKYGGRIVVVGFAGRGGEMERVKVNKILLNAASVVGYRFGEQSRREPEKTEAVQNAVTRLIDAGAIAPIVYYKHYVGLQAIPAAMTDVKNRKVWGRAVVSISNEDDDSGVTVFRRKESNSRRDSSL
ncbi:zeta-crystallin [Macrophomina phaseolina]|uniref:Zeta-crystallin n=1 Tax=Macrophomina phaseolina TaxID=35725 RepID=A0ABQ8FTI3_9PEZI|nr:zeta-crystallin [Macrophomina phaseolina]